MKKISSQDRSALIRLASSLPAGSEERKAILAGLNKTSRAGEAEARAGHKEFGRANLYRANLRGVDLTGANLNSADLTGANLTDADLYRANLKGANLNGAILANTIMPNGKSFTGSGEKWMASQP